MKKADCQKIEAFELWCWGRLLRVPWTARRSNQSILKEISPEYSWKGLMLKLKLQYFGHLMLIGSDSLDKTLMLGKIEGRRRSGWQRIRWLVGTTNEWIWVWASPGVGDRQRSLACCSPWGCKELDMTEWLNWTLFIISVTKWLVVISRYRIYTHRKIVIKHIQKHIYCPLRTIYKLFKYDGEKKKKTEAKM